MLRKRLCLTLFAEIATHNPVQAMLKATCNCIGLKARIVGLKKWHLCRSRKRPEVSEEVSEDANFFIVQCEG